MERQNRGFEAGMLQDKHEAGEDVGDGFPQQQSALPGTGGLARIVSAAVNSYRGLKEGIRSEAAIKQEAALFVIAIPLAFVIATSIWVWVAMVASLLVVLLTEFLNTAVERLCDHVTPQRHEAIRVTKDLASAGVFFSIALAALVWVVALLERFGLFA